MNIKDASILKYNIDNNIKSGKKDYKQTKQLAIKYTNILLDKYKLSDDILKLNRKKDDLCDAFLLAYVSII